MQILLCITNLFFGDNCNHITESSFLYSLAYPAAASGSVWQDSKQYFNWRKMEETKNGKWRALQLKRSWGTACPNSLLCKGSCCIMLYFHMSAPQVWPGVLGAKRKPAMIRRKIKESSLEFRTGRLGSEQRDSSRVFTHKGKPEKRVTICINGREVQQWLQLLCNRLSHEAQMVQKKKRWWCLKTFIKRQGETGTMIRQCLEFKREMCASDTGLISCCESGPGLIRPPVIVLSVWHLHIVTEADEDFGLSQLLHCWPLAQLEEAHKEGGEKKREKQLFRTQHLDSLHHIDISATVGELQRKRSSFNLHDCSVIALSSQRRSFCL